MASRGGRAVCRTETSSPLRPSEFDRQDSPAAADAVAGVSIGMRHVHTESLKKQARINCLTLPWALVSPQVRLDLTSPSRLREGRTREGRPMVWQPPPPIAIKPSPLVPRDPKGG